MKPTRVLCLSATFVAATSATVTAATTAAYEGGADTPFTSQGFGTGPAPAISAVGGTPGGYLQLTQAVNDANNFATYERTDVGNYPAANFSFNFRIMPVATPSADGISFSLISTALYGNTGGLGAPIFTPEDPAAAGVLGFAFDTWSNQGAFDNPGVGTGSDYNEISVFYNGALVNRIDDTRLLAVPLTLDDAQWHRVDGSVNFAGGSVSMTVDGQVIYNNLAVPGLSPFESRVLFAGRTGGENEDAGIDNLNVAWVPEPATASLGLLAALGLLRRRRA